MVLSPEDRAGRVDLVASVVSSTVCSVPELAFCRVTVSRYLESLHLAETSVTCLCDHPRL